MIKEEKIIKNIEEIKRNYFCDICKQEIKIVTAYSYGNCYICKRGVCKNCISHEEYGGDYRGDIYCKICWDIGNRYRETIMSYEKLIDNLHNDWQKECLQQKGE